MEIEFQIGFQNRKSKWFWNGIWIQGNSNGFEWRNSNGVKNKFEYGIQMGLEMNLNIRNSNGVEGEFEY